MKQVEVINQHLNMDPGIVYCAELHGAMADLALTSGYRYVQPFEGMPNAEETEPSKTGVFLAETAELNLPFHNPEFVCTYKDPNLGTRFYIDEWSVGRCVKQLSRANISSRAAQAALKEVMRWSPEVFTVSLPTNARLGLYLATLPRLVKIVEGVPPQHGVVSYYIRGDGPLYLTAEQKRAFLQFAKVVLTPPEVVK
jgi:hypothetical protein